jgi:hypothetical protein
MWEGDDLLVGLAGGQAVVQAADEAVEEVALRGGVVVAGVPAAFVVRAGAGRRGPCGERSEVARDGESVVLDPPVHHRP